MANAQTVELNATAIKNKTKEKSQVSFTVNFKSTGKDTATMMGLTFNPFQNGRCNTLHIKINDTNGKVFEKNIIPTNSINPASTFDGVPNLNTLLPDSFITTKVFLYADSRVSGFSNFDSGGEKFDHLPKGDYTAVFTYTVDDLFINGGCYTNNNNLFIKEKESDIWHGKVVSNTVQFSITD
ncbi:MAG: hypothetical protein M0D57_10940 [Sphingobacteriales bacterium JAD_PAG50586_3]|nr:MAG: hypothetical protein M0D57_10940 [Sphingobacteriales bacterium JAD_PAG50586_3]